MPERIRVTEDDLYARKIDEIIAEQEALLRPAGELEPTPLWRRIVFNSLFFLSVAGLLGGLAGWAILEPQFNESVVIWGKLEYINQHDALTGLAEITVRGVRAYVDPKSVRVDGRGAYADIDAFAKLRAELPVRVQVMPIESAGRSVAFADRISVREIPEGRDLEPLPDLSEMGSTKLLAGVFAFAIIGSCIAGVIGAADGFMSRNLRRGLLSGIAGVGIAVGGGLAALIPAGMILGLAFQLISLRVGEGVWTSATLTGFSLLILIVGRALAWGVFGLTIGLGPGAALRSKTLALNGLLGGLLGAILGGMFFEPIIKLFANTDWGGEAMASRAFGFAVIGLSTGFMIGLVEHLSREAWLLMRAGPLAGKQFVLYKSPTTLGSSPKCEVYLFKDPDVEPRHALIRKVGNRHDIEDLNTPAGTFVGGRRVRREMLKDGDQITLGKTVLEYTERSRRRS